MNSKIAVYLYNLSNVYRFNGFGHPSNKRQDYVTHSYNSLAISTMIGHKVRLNNTINLEKVYGKIIFGSLHPIFFGDIPKALGKNNPDLSFAFTEAKTLYSKKLSLEFSTKYRDIFQSYLVKTNNTSVEEEVAKQSENFSVLMKCETELRAISNQTLKKLKKDVHQHILNGEKVYPSKEVKDVFGDEEFEDIQFNNFLEVYFDTINSIRESFLPEVDWYFKEVYFSPFTKLIDNMQDVFRWGNQEGEEDHDGQHSFYVSMWSFLLGLSERLEYNQDISIERLIGKAVFHDMHETITSDIITMIKRVNPTIEGMINEVEDTTNYLILSIIPKELQHIFEDYICNPKSSDIEGDITHIADKIEAAIKSLREVKNNNRKYLKGYDSSVKVIIEQAHKYNSVKDFFTYTLHEFYIEL